MHSGICASSMHTIYLIIVFLLLTSSLKAQHIDTDTLHSDESFEHTQVKRIAGDSLSTSFIIWVKKEVRSHKHEQHSESIFVLEGTAEMTLGKEVLIISPGDYVFIPINTYHSVLVKQGVLKVLSIQSPHFDGADRVWEK